jgi:hypothetical protein
VLQFGDVMNKVFSLPFKRFDHIPEDSELVCLLGDDFYAGKISVIETPESIVACPWMIPIKYMVPWILFVASIITAVLWFARYYSSGLSVTLVWGMIALLWLGAVPGFLGMILFINHEAAKRSDLFKVDKLLRTLELPQVHKTITASEILAFTENYRWCHLDYTRQAGVLIKTPEGQCELYPMFREVQENGYKQGDQLIAQLVRIFQVPVRKVTLNKEESKALKDC